MRSVLIPVLAHSGFVRFPLVVHGTGEDRSDVDARIVNDETVTAEEFSRQRNGDDIDVTITGRSTVLNVRIVPLR